MVKEQYPTLFPANFSEALVRHKWEKKNGGKSSDGQGKGWRKGKTIIPTEALVFIGTLIMGQYAAGVPLTSTLLVPLVAGAFWANGLGDKITLEPKALAQASSHDATLHFSGRWVLEFCRTVHPGRCISHSWISFRPPVSCGFPYQQKRVPKIYVGTFQFSSEPWKL